MRREVDFKIGLVITFFEPSPVLYICVKHFLMAIPILYQDNISTIVSAAQGLQRFNKMSHVNMRYFAIKQEIDQERIRMPHMPSENMISDTLTKCSGPKHRILRQRDLYMNCTEEEARARAEELHLTPDTPGTRTEKDSVMTCKRKR